MTYGLKIKIIIILCLTNFIIFTGRNEEQAYIIMLYSTKHISKEVFVYHNKVYVIVSKGVINGS